MCAWQEYGCGTRAGKRSLGAPVDGWIVSRRVWMAEITICMACYGRTWYGGVPIVQITSRPPRHLVGRALVHLDQAGRHKRRLRSSVSSCYAHTASLWVSREPLRLDQNVQKQTQSVSLLGLCTLSLTRNLNVKDISALHCWQAERIEEERSKHL